MNTRCLTLLFPFCVVIACGDPGTIPWVPIEVESGFAPDDDDDDDDDDGDGDGVDDDADQSTLPPTEDSTGSGWQSEDASSSSGEGESSGGVLDDSAEGELLHAPSLPTARDDCPDVDTPYGELLTFQTDLGPRQVMVWADAGSGGGGPLLFWYHGSGNVPESAIQSLSDDVIDYVVDHGGAVVAPVPSGDADIEWFLTTEDREDDLVLQDVVVGCLHEGATNIDPYNIHLAGFSAGALHASQALLRRNEYVASLVAYSGGIHFPGGLSDGARAAGALLAFHGGDSDVVLDLPFAQSTEALAEAVVSAQGFAVVCNHGLGHGYPANETGAGGWNRPRALEFMLVHPYGQWPSIYTSYGLPIWLPTFCEMR